MNNIEIGLAKRARNTYTFDDIAIAPSRRARDPQDVSLDWQIDAYRFEHPIVAAPMDSVMSPESAVAFAQLGGLAVLNLEGLWTRFEDPSEALRAVHGVGESQGATVRHLQELYQQPVDAELVAQRIKELQNAGITVAGSLSPQKTVDLAEVVTSSGVDIFVIRGTTVSAEYVTTSGAPLNLKQFIYDLDVPVIVGGCATYRSALHLMRAGAAGVLVGFGGGATQTTHDVLGIRVPMASAIADVVAARRDYLDESGGRYVNVIADGAMGTSGAMVKAIACGADAVMVGSPLAKASDSPGKGVHWGMEATHPDLPRGEVVSLGQVGTTQEVLFGPSTVSDGTMNLTGAIRRAMATCGYVDLKEFQRVEVIVDL